jgi:methylated-DNA-[protein]-cysteine S-methyltransferase
MSGEWWTSFRVAPGWLIHAAASDRGIARIEIGGDRQPAGEDPHPLLARVRRQLEEYFRGERTEFDVPLDLRGTEFELRVWEKLQEVPYGETIRYAQLAQRVGSPRAFRAVGRANGKNPVPIIVPCHRVIASGGGLGGYSAGISYKRLLLELEASNTKRINSSARSSSTPIFSQ